MPDTTSPRDELVTLLEQHEGHDCICGEWSGSYPERHLADVLLAAGWSKAACAHGDGPCVFSIGVHEEDKP